MVFRRPLEEVASDLGWNGAGANGSVGEATGSGRSRTSLVTEPRACGGLARKSLPPVSQRMPFRRPAQLHVYRADRVEVAELVVTAGHLSLVQTAMSNDAGNALWQQANESISPRKRRKGDEEKDAIHHRQKTASAVNTTESGCHLKRGGPSRSCQCDRHAT